MIYGNTTAALREDLQAAVVQGRGVNALNIGSKLLPRYGVNRRNGHLLTMGIAGMEMLRIMDKVVEPGSNVDRIQLSFDGQTYTVVVRKEEAGVPDEEELEYGDYVPLEAAAAQVLTDKLDLTHEYLTAAAIFNTTTFGAATNSAVAYTEANIATISLIRDIQDAIQRVRDNGEQPDTVVIPDKVFQRCRRATLVQNFVAGQLAAGKEVTSSSLQAAFADEGIKQVLIGSSMYNNAASKATPSVSKIWANTYIWVGRCGAGSATVSEGGVEMIDGVGATLFWDGFGAREIETYRDEPKASNIVRAKTSEVPTVLNSRGGTLLATQYA